MKAQRRAAIVEIIRKHRVQNQEHLGTLLAKSGFETTQSTLSRDLRDLGLVKIHDPAGGSFYAVPPDREVPHPSLEQLVPALLLSVDYVGPMVVVKTPQGSAEALGGALDGSSWDDVIGTIAGDDTLLVISKSDAARKRVVSDLKAMAGI